MPVTVKGPDGRDYKFPDKTTKEQAVAYFKKNKVATPPAAHDVKASPSLMSKEGAKEAMYDLTDKGTNALPAAGGMLGGALGFGEGTAVEPGGGSGVGAAVGAGLGSAAGADAKQMLRRKIFGTGPKNLTEGLPEIETEFALGAGSEGFAQTLTAPMRMLMKALKPAVESEEKAAAGTGFRMLPGQASGSPGMKAVEGAVGHLPGGIGTMEKFQEAQNKEMLLYLDKQLEGISKSTLKPEEAGNAVKMTVKGLRDQLVKSADASTKMISHQQQELYKSVQSMVRRDALEHPERLTKEEWSKILNPDFVDNATLDSAVQKAGSPETKAKLVEADKFFREGKTQLKATSEAQKQNLERAVVEKILKSRPELMQDYFTKASLEELRTMNRIIPPQERADIAKAVYSNVIDKAVDAQTKMVDPTMMAKSLKSIGDEKGKLIFGKDVWNNLQEAQKLLNKVPKPSGGAGGFHMKRMMLESAAGGGLGVGALATGHPLVAAAAASAVPLELGTMKTIAVALTNPKTSTWALNWLRMLTVGAGRTAHAGVSAAISDNAPVMQH